MRSLQSVFHRAVEWRRLAWNPVVGTRRIPHTRAATIDARAPETVEAIRAQLDVQRQGEAYALTWASCSTTAAGRASGCASGKELSTMKSQRGREPELHWGSHCVSAMCAIHTILVRDGREASLPPDLGHADPGFTVSHLRARHAVRLPETARSDHGSDPKGRELRLP